MWIAMATSHSHAPGRGASACASTSSAAFTLGEISAVFLQVKPWENHGKTIENLLGDMAALPYECKSKNGDIIERNEDFPKHRFH